MKPTTRFLREACCVLCLAASAVGAQASTKDLPADFGGGDRAARGQAEPALRLALAEHKPAPRAKRESRRESQKPAPKKPQEAAPEPEPPPAPYDPQLLRLAEVLGGLSYLRDLCGDGDGEEWRGKMAQLRDATAPTGSRRQKLTNAFNHGFHGYEITYRVCTPNAQAIIERYLDEAERLSRDVAVRYGNP
jgi:uncharacterized protein (TIGR02301 family)